MTDEELMAKVHAAVERTRAERARIPGSRGRVETDPDSGALSEDEERERADRGR